MSNKKKHSRFLNPLDYRPDWKHMTGRQKAGYIWDYFKLPILVICLIIYIIGYICYRYATRTYPVIYVVPVNVLLSDEQEEVLSDGYMQQRTDPEQTVRDCVDLSGNMFYTSDPETPLFQENQAGQIKILASITAGSCDVALMNEDAFNFFSQNCYLQDLDELPQLKEFSDNFVINTAVLEDNSGDVEIDPSIELKVVTADKNYGIDLSGSPLLGEAAGFENTVYAGIIGNSERADEAAAYVRYLCGK